MQLHINITLRELYSSWNIGHLAAWGTKRDLRDQKLKGPGRKNPFAVYKTNWNI